MYYSLCIYINNCRYDVFLFILTVVLVRFWNLKLISIYLNYLTEEDVQHINVYTCVHSAGSFWCFVLLVKKYKIKKLK